MTSRNYFKCAGKVDYIKPIAKDSDVYSENPDKNTVGAYTAQKGLLKKVIENIGYKKFEKLTNRRVVVDDFQDSDTTEEAFNEAYRIEVEDRLMHFPKDELIELNKVATKHTAEWLVKTIFNRRIRRTKQVL